MPFQVAFASIDLAPPLGGSMPGYFTDRKATGFIDPIQARAIVIKSPASGPVAIVSLDLVALSRDDVKKCRQAVALSTKIKPENVWIHATHTHTGPMIPRFYTTDVNSIFPGFYPGTVDIDFMNRLYANVGQVVKNAADTLQASPMAIGSAHVSGAAMYRRFRLKDGSVLTNAARKDSRVVGPAGEIDPSLTLVSFPGARCAIAIYGIHPDVIGGTLYSADYPATLAAEFKRHSGHDLLFLNAACGNINHVDRSRENQLKGIDESRRIGRLLANAAAEALGKAKPTNDESLKIDRLDHPSRLRTIPENIVQEALRLEKDEPAKARNFNGMFAPAAIVLGRTKDREHPAEIMALRLGPIGLVGMPGEIFVELARELQHEAPLDLVRLIGLSNGGMGYIPTSKAFGEGGYETGYRSARYQPETGHQWVQSALKLMRKLV